MAFWCYILRCADGRYYTGHTDDLDRRIGQHQEGGACGFTSRRRPVTLVWSQDFPSRLEALEAERRISPWSRAKKEALIAGDWEALSHWSRPPRERPSTSLGTNGAGGSRPLEGMEPSAKPPFVPSAVEAPVPEFDRGTSPLSPFVPSEVEAPRTP